MRRIPGFRPLYVKADGTAFGSMGQSIFRLDEFNMVPKFIASYKGGIVQTLSEKSRIFSRLMRGGFQGLFALADGSWLGLVRGRMLKLDTGKKEFRSVFKIPRGSRPLNICVMPNGHIFWGEYFYNSKRREVHIYGSFDHGETWRTVYTFSPGSIRHIHAIVYDPFRLGCWVLTGDLDHESKILFSKYPFHDLKPIFEGSQQFRSACLIPRENDLITGMDTSVEENFIQSLDPVSKTVRKVQKVPGSVFFATIAGKYLIVSTAVEPSAINEWPYASLWISRDGENWSEFYRDQRDNRRIPKLPGLPEILSSPTIFQHGVFTLPQGNCRITKIYAYGQALKENDDECLYWTENNLEAPEDQHQSRPKGKSPFEKFN